MPFEVFFNLKVIVWLVFATINFLSFFYVFLDKRRAIKKRDRIPEVDLFLWGVFLGSFGVLCGMYFFRHKTRKWYFVAGFSFLFLQNVLVVLKLLEILA